MKQNKIKIPKYMHKALVNKTYYCNDGRLYRKVISVYLGHEKSELMGQRRRAPIK